MQISVPTVDLQDKKLVRKGRGVGGSIFWVLLQVKGKNISLSCPGHIVLLWLMACRRHDLLSFAVERARAGQSEEAHFHLLYEET